MGSDHTTYQPYINICYVLEHKYIFQHVITNPKGFGHIAKSAEVAIHAADLVGRMKNRQRLEYIDAMEYSDETNECANCGTEIRHGKRFCQYCAIEQMA
jgi:ribosomal protein L32